MRPVTELLLSLSLAATFCSSLSTALLIAVTQLSLSSGCVAWMRYVNPAGVCNENKFCFSALCGDFGLFAIVNVVLRFGADEEENKRDVEEGEEEGDCDGDGEGEGGGVMDSADCCSSLLSNNDTVNPCNGIDP